MAPSQPGGLIWVHLEAPCVADMCTFRLGGPARCQSWQTVPLKMGDYAVSPRLHRGEKVGFGIFLGSKLFRQVGRSIACLVFPRREQTRRLKPGLEARQVWERLISPPAAALTIRCGKTVLN